MARPTLACVEFCDLKGKLYKVYIDNFKNPPTSMKQYSTSVPYSIKWQKSGIANDGYYDGIILFLASKFNDVFFSHVRV